MIAKILLRVTDRLNNLSKAITKKYTVPEESIGTCPHCGRRITVPMKNGIIEVECTFCGEVNYCHAFCICSNSKDRLKYVRGELESWMVMADGEFSVVVDDA